MDLQQAWGVDSASTPYISVARDERGGAVWVVVVQVATGAHAVEVCEALRRALQPPEME